MSRDPYDPLANIDVSLGRIADSLARLVKILEEWEQ